MRNATLWCLAIIIIAGNIIGVGIGYVSVVVQSYYDATNCTRLQADHEACAWADDKICHWNGTFCEFRALHDHNASCSTIPGQDECEAETESCIWMRPRGVEQDQCRFQRGWDKTDTALVGAIATIGGIIGSMLVHTSITRAGLNHTIVLCGLVSTLAAALCIVAWHSPDDATRLGLLLTGRCLTGVALGMASASVPMYVGDVATREVAGVLGVGFQVCITFGIMTAAMIGFAANPSLEIMHPRNGVHALNYYYLALSILLMPAAYFADRPLFDDAMRSSLLTFRHSAFLRIQPGGATNDYGNAPQEEASLFRRPLYVAVAILIAAGQQLSGVNAVISYVSIMSADVGMENPYLAAFVLFAWNFVCTIFSIYLAYRTTAGNMFLFGELGAALACFVIAVPIYFYDETQAAAQAIVIVGMFLFILLFELSMGPTFYVLAQSMFPSEIRAAGCSFTIFAQFVCNGIVTFVYPILVKSFSGGPSKPQDKGIGAMFFCFGAAGIVLTIALKYVMVQIRKEHQPPEELGEEAAIGGNTTERLDNLTQY